MGIINQTAQDKSTMQNTEFDCSQSEPIQEPILTTVKSGKEIQAAIETLIFSQSLYINPLFQILEICKDEQPRALVESYIDDAPEMHAAIRTASSLVQSLINAGALHEEIEADDVRMSREGYEQALADENFNGFNDVEVYICVTENGKAVACAHSPNNRYKTLLKENSDYQKVYEDVLDFCKSPRQLHDVELEIQSLGFATSRNAQHKKCVYPLFILEGLQSVGALAWDKGWNTTPAGQSILAPN